MTEPTRLSQEILDDTLRNIGDEYPSVEARLRAHIVALEEEVAELKRRLSEEEQEVALKQAALNGLARLKPSEQVAKDLATIEARRDEDEATCFTPLTACPCAYHVALRTIATKAQAHDAAVDAMNEDGAESREWSTLAGRIRALSEDRQGEKLRAERAEKERDEALVLYRGAKASKEAAVAILGGEEGENLKDVAERVASSLARLRLSGQVAEDERAIRSVFDHSCAVGGELTGKPCRACKVEEGALSHLATKAQGCDAFVAACREALGPHRSTGTPADVAMLHKDLEVARAFSVRFGQERDAAVADARRRAEETGIFIDALQKQRDAAVAASAAWRDVAAELHRDAPAARAGIDDEATIARWNAAKNRYYDLRARPDPSNALLEEHRKALARARNEGLEMAATIECDGCRTQIHVGGHSVPPKWFMDGKPPPGWKTLRIHDGSKRWDLCPACWKTPSMEEAP